MGIESEDASTQLLFSNTFHRTIDKNTLDRFTFVGKEFTYFFFISRIYITFTYIFNYYQILRFFELCTLKKSSLNRGDNRICGGYFHPNGMKYKLLTGQ